MAVLDSKKLLPSSKKESKKTVASNAAKFLVPVKNIQYRNVADLKNPEEDSSKTSFDIRQDILVIKSKVISIEEILKKSLKIQNQKTEDSRKKLEDSNRRKKENLLEKLQDNKTKKELPKLLPRFSFLDALKNFITNTLLGFVFYRLIKYLPQVIEFTKKLAPAIDFIESFVGGMANKLISFIDFGYKVYDTVRATIKNIGGENVQKTFDDFSSKLNTFINLAIIAGMSTMGGTDFGLGKNKSKAIGQQKLPPTSPTGFSSTTNQRLNKYLNRGKEAKLVERKFGNNAAKYYEELRESGKNSAQAFKEVKRRFEPRGLFNRQSVAGLAGNGQTPGQVGRRGFGRTTTRVAAKSFGKGGAKVASGASKALSRFPIIGPLVDFSFRYFVLKEPLGKATAGAVGAGIGQALGSWIGGTIGGIAGSVVPIIGNILAGGAGAAIGGIIGGLIGDQIGVSLYETISQYNQTPVEARAGGGQITRGGRSVGGPIKRTLKYQRRSLKPQKLPVEKLKPGKDLGNKKTIEKIFNPEDKSKPKQISSLRTLTNVSQILKGSNTNFFGKIAGIGVDLALGQKPSKNFVLSLGASLGNIIQDLIDSNSQITASETARSILAMANGGIVPESMVTRGGNFGKKVGDAISSMLQSFVDNQSNLIMSLLKQESEKEPFGGSLTTGPGGVSTTGGQVAEGTLSRGQITIEQLVGLAKGAGFSESDAVIMAAIAMAESGGNSNAHNQNAATGDNSYGLWQINMIGRLGPERLKQFGISNYEQLKDPVVNAHAAKKTKESQGFSAWSVYKSGKYKAYLSMAQRASKSPAITVYKPGTGGGSFVPLGSMGGTLLEAQKLASSMGLQTTSTTHWSDGTRRSGLHGAGRAMDFSNGVNTPQQMAFAKEMVRRYGTKIEQLIYTPLGYGILKGKKVGLDTWGKKVNDQHYNHVHVAFKKGGYTGAGGVARLHRNEMVMTSNAVDFFGRNTFEAMNAIGDKSAKLKMINSKKIKSYSNLDMQTSYEEQGESTIVILPIYKEIKNTKITGSKGNGFVNLSSNFNNIDNSIESALA